MAAIASLDEITAIPDGYRAIPVSPTEHQAALKLCVLVRQTPDPAAGHLVLLRDLHDARVYLGCVTDASGRAREWVEVWIQSVEGLEASLPSYREAFSNQALDDRWAARSRAQRQLNPRGCLWTGWEETHPPPVFVNLATGTSVYLEGEAGGRWELCRNDELLRAAELPAYSTSLARYLFQPQAGPQTRFVPVVPAAPANAHTRPLSEVLKSNDHHLPLNTQGGLMMVTGFCPLGYEEYVDLLGGKPWPGIEHGKTTFMLDGSLEELNRKDGTGWPGQHWFPGGKGRAGRFLENYHLKLQLITEAMRLIRAATQQHQLPFLNIGADSFRVRLGDAGAGLPRLWSARGTLVKPSAAYALPVETSDFKYFIRARSNVASVYLPEGLTGHLSGSGSVRITNLMPVENDRTVIEGTLVVQNELPVSPNDLLWIRLPLPSGRVDLYGHLYSQEGLTYGDVRFRTIPQRLTAPVVASIQASAGVSFARSPFEVVPLLTSPCDLHSLGVLAVRTLLVNHESPLPVALDAMLSLSRKIASEHQPNSSIAERIRQSFEKDKRFVASLGPHRLTRDDLTPDQAFQLLPPEVWFDTLAAIVRLFPGMGPDSVCKDFGDAPSLALEAVFNQPLEDWERLLLRSRSLLVIDWNANREMHSVIRDLLIKAGAGS